jgi:hypothetical protein
LRPALTADGVSDPTGQPRGRLRFGNLLMKPNHLDVLFPKDLCEAGKVSRLNDRWVLLSEVPAAVRYVEADPTRGEAVITI